MLVDVSTTFVHEYLDVFLPYTWVFLWGVMLCVLLIWAYRNHLALQKDVQKLEEIHQKVKEADLAVEKAEREYREAYDQYLESVAKLALETSRIVKRML